MTLYKRTAALLLLAVAAPLGVTAGTVGAVVTDESTVKSNTFDTAGYVPDDIGPHNALAAPVTGKPTFEPGDRGFIALDLAKRTNPTGGLPRTRAGDVLQISLELPPELTVDAAPKPAGAPARYAMNWCDPAATLPTFIRSVDCSTDDDTVTVNLTLARSLTASNWAVANVEIGVTADTTITNERATISASVRLPTDNDTTVRSTTLPTAFTLSPSALGIHAPQLARAGGETAWEHKDAGSMSFSVLPGAAAGDKIYVKNGESFAVLLTAFNPSRDDDAAGRPRRGGIEFDENKIAATNPCTRQSDAGWMPGYSIRCERVTAGETAPESALKITFTRTSDTAWHVLPRSSFAVPVTNSYSSVDEAAGTGNSTITFTPALTQPVTGPATATTTTTLLNSNTLGIVALTVNNAFGSSASIISGTTGNVSAHIASAAGAPVRTRTGDQYQVQIRLPYVQDAVDPDSGPRGGLSIDRASTHENTCNRHGEEITPGFTLTCDYGAPDFTPAPPGPTTVTVTLTRTGPDDAAAVMPRIRFRLPVHNDYRNTSAAWAAQPSATFTSTSRQAFLGDTERETRPIQLLTPRLALRDFKSTPDSGATTNNWLRNEAGWTQFRIAQPGKVHLNAKQGDTITVKLDTQRYSNTDDSIIGGGLWYGTGEPGDICGLTAPNALWDGWTVSCQATASTPQDLPHRLTITITRTGGDSAAAEIDDRLLQVRMLNNRTDAETLRALTQFNLSSTINAIGGPTATSVWQTLQ